MSKERPSHTDRERALPRDGAPPPRQGEASPGAPGSGAQVAMGALAAPRPSGRCTAQVVEGEAVLLDLTGKQLVGLNPVGTFVFGLLDGVRTVPAIVAAVAERFDVGHAQAEADVAVFLRELTQRGLVEGGSK